MALRSLMSVADTSEDSQGATLTVFFCIPNTPDWRRATTALLSNYTYGRAYDGSTTNIKLAQEVGRKIFNSMAMCDLETSLVEISQSLQTIADNTPKLYGIQEILDLAGSPGGIDFEQIESFLNILGVLPDIKIDPLKYLFEWIWRSQMLANSYAQSTAQGSIAAALTAGLGIEGILGGLEIADTATDEILDIINGGSAALQTIIAAVSLFKDENSGSEIKVLNDVAIALQVQCTGCGQPQGACHCQPEVGGPVAEEAAQSLLECCTPVGFTTFSEYDNYACAAANWIADKSLLAIKQLELLHNRFFYDYSQAKQTNKLGPTEVYKRMVEALPDIFGDTWLFSIPNDDRAAIATILTDRYLDFQNEVATTVPETQTIEDVVDNHFTQTYSPVVSDLESTLDADKQTYFDSDGPLGLLSDFLQTMTDAAGQALGYQPGDVQELVNHAVKQGLANTMYYKNLVIDVYNGDYVCLGSKCTCPEFWVATGTQTGANTFVSKASIVHPGRHDLVVFVNWDSGPNELCGPEAAMTMISIVGWSQWLTNDFEIINSMNNVVYQGSGPWPPGTVGRHINIMSSSSFTANIAFVSEGC